MSKITVFSIESLALWIAQGKTESPFLVAPTLGSLLPLLEHRAEFPQFLDQGQSVGLLGRVISSSQGKTEQTGRNYRKHISCLISLYSSYRTPRKYFRFLLLSFPRIIFRWHTDSEVSRRLGLL
jgi:hypothetical protein